MRKRLIWALIAGLLLAPAAPLLAADEAPAAVPASDTAKADPDQPPLPDVQTGEAKDAPEAATGTAAVAPEVPKDALPKPGVAKPEAKESRFKASNFLLGLLGGVLIGGGGGILFTTGDMDSQRITTACLIAGGTGLTFGTVALLLGATTPPEAKPPKVDDARIPAGVPLVALALRF